MSVTISGSSGIASVDGSAGSPSVRGSDANSGILYTADAIKFSTGGTQRVVIDNNGLSSAGHIVQTVSVTKTARAQSSADSGGESGTLFEASITPTSSSNKILLFGSMTIGCAAAVSVAIRLKIDGALTEGRGVGIAVGNRRYVTSRSSEQSSGNDDMDSIPFNYLDSPNTTSEVTYSFVAMHSSAQTRIVTINRSENDANQTYNHVPISTMTLMEVAV